MSARRGVLAFVLGFVLLGLIVLFAAFLLRGSGAPRSSQPAVLVFEVPEILDESAPPPRIFPFPGLWTVRHSRMTTYDVLRALRAAGGDDHVAALVLHVGPLDWGWARVGEVRDAVMRFRRSGKPVYASLTGGGEREYLLASAAGMVAMPPTAELQIDGLVATATYYRGAFDKFGVSPNFVHVGRFKSAVEPYTRTGMSPDARVAISAVLDDLYAMLLDDLGHARGLSREAMARLVDQGPFTSGDARGLGLLDTLLYDTEVDSLALRPGGRRLRAESFSHYLARLETPALGTRMALVVASGTIVSGRSHQNPGQEAELGSETLIEALREARRRSAIKAIVLRIDSPGGEAQASDDIWREVERCRAVKPVIVSMSDVAASGGYYIAVAADSIVASPATLTGSIGIYGGKLNVLGLYRKLGLNVETVTRGRHAGMLSPFRDFTPEESQRFAASLESFYRGFVTRVARGRRLAEGAVDSVAEGRVWTGRAAQARGLVDRIGGLETAFDMARARAHIPRGADLIVERYPRVRRSFYERLLESAFSDDDRDVALSIPPILRAWTTVARLPNGQPLAIMPYRIEVR
jgi:protease-4